MPTVKPIIFDGETHRPMTNDEYAQWQADNEAHAAQVEAQAAKAKAKASALAKLGLTADEAAALLG